MALRSKTTTDPHQPRPTASEYLERCQCGAIGTIQVTGQPWRCGPCWDRLEKGKIAGARRRSSGSPPTKPAEQTAAVNPGTVALNRLDFQHSPGREQAEEAAE
jgi:hypothetical protein